MPVIYEPASFLPPSSSSSSASQPHHRPLRPPPSRSLLRTLDFGFLPNPAIATSPLLLAGLCGLLALFALLIRFLRRPLSAASPAPSTPSPPLPPLPLHIRAILDAAHRPLSNPSLHSHPAYLDEKRETVSLAASYYDTDDDLGMEQSPIDASTKTTANSAIATTPTDQRAMTMPSSESGDWEPAWQDGSGSAKGLPKTSMDGLPPRRRSYNITKSAPAAGATAAAALGSEDGQGGVQRTDDVPVLEEIIVAEGWRRHTRVYGGGVCLACAESERRNQGFAG